MDNKAFAKVLENRTLQFAKQIINLSIKLPNTSEARIIKSQITKAGTSIGANYREANRSRSKADFRSRIKICESEASETQYWSEIISEMQWAKPEEIREVYEDCSELLALFTAIGKNIVK